MTPRFNFFFRWFAKRYFRHFDLDDPTVQRLLELVHGLRAAILSLDDIYLSGADRLQRANTIHPLLATRGVPGTHDVGLGLQLLIVR